MQTPKLEDAQVLHVKSKYLQLTYTHILPYQITHICHSRNATEIVVTQVVCLQRLHVFQYSFSSIFALHMVGFEDMEPYRCRGLPDKGASRVHVQQAFGLAVKMPIHQRASAGHLALAPTSSFLLRSSSAA